MASRLEVKFIEISINNYMINPLGGKAGRLKLRSEARMHSRMYLRASGTKD